MNKIKRKYVLLLICVFFVLLMGSTYTIEDGSAWSNGKLGYGLSIAEYKMDYERAHQTRLSSSYYSTHD